MTKLWIDLIVLENKIAKKEGIRCKLLYEKRAKVLDKIKKLISDKEFKELIEKMED